MITRGTLVGKIVDDLGILNSKIQFRSKLGLLDLNKYCEDFFKEVLNITFNLNLKNLNDSRSNEPGLDLGDSKNKIAFQITSTPKSDKINKTLKKITQEQLSIYEKIQIFIIGKKQHSYGAVENSLIKKCKFRLEENILDINDLLKQIISLNHDDLHDLYQLFKKEFQRVITELETPDNEGNYETNYSDKLEISPNTFCKSAKLFFKEYELENEIIEIRKVFDDLGKLPRITREFLKIVIQLDEEKHYHENQFSVNYYELKRKLNIPENQLKEEIMILTSRQLLFYYDDEELPEVKTHVSEFGFFILSFAKEKEFLQKLIVNLDFTLLDEN